MACVCTLADIEKFCGGINAPGLTKQLQIACEDDIDSIPAPDSGKHLISADIQMVSGKVFKTWNFDQKNATYSSARDENGQWATEVKIFVPKLTDEKTNIFNGVNGDNYIVTITDLNGGDRRLIGKLNLGCMVDVKETSDPKNGYEITIKWVSPHAPYWYSGVIAV